MIQKNNRTEKLYETDSHCREFTARVLRREKGDAGWEIVLDRTAFFPEGGGQLWDTGTLNGIAVRNVQEKDGEIVHFTDAPLEEGSTVTGKLDWEQRFERMQGHSGEHIVSGLIHTRYGLENVGFHLGSEDITLDFNGSLSREQLDSIEEDLDTIEEYLLDDEDEEDDEDEDEDWDDEDEFDFGDETIYEVKCPVCGSVINLDEEMLDAGSIECPDCGEELEFDVDEED